MKIQLLDPKMPIPAYATGGAAAFDVRSVEPTFTLFAGEQRLVRLGFKVAVPQGYGGLLLARSGNAHRLRLSFGNGVGLIDSDYRGEVCALLRNDNEAGTKAVTIHTYDRIGQFVVVPILRPELEVAESLDDTERGEGGFGSTGLVDGDRLLVQMDLSGYTPACRCSV